MKRLLAIAIILGSVLVLNAQDLKLSQDVTFAWEIGPRPQMILCKHADGKIDVFTDDGRLIASRLPDGKIVKGIAYSPKALRDQIKQVIVKVHVVMAGRT